MSKKAGRMRPRRPRGLALHAGAEMPRHIREDLLAALVKNIPPRKGFGSPAWCCNLIDRQWRCGFRPLTRSAAGNGEAPEQGTATADANNSRHEARPASTLQTRSGTPLRFAANPPSPPHQDPSGPDYPGRVSAPAPQPLACLQILRAHPDDDASRATERDRLTWHEHCTVTNSDPQNSVPVTLRTVPP